MIRTGGAKKGDVLGVARIAGIMAAKRTAELIPLCHPLPISAVSVELEVGADAVEIAATVRTSGQTGVEMEALTAAWWRRLRCTICASRWTVACGSSRCGLRTRLEESRGSSCRSDWQLFALYSGRSS